MKKFLTIPLLLLAFQVVAAPSISCIAKESAPAQFNEYSVRVTNNCGECAHVVWNIFLNGERHLLYPGDQKENNWSPGSSKTWRWKMNKFGTWEWRATHVTACNTNSFSQSQSQSQSQNSTTTQPKGPSNPPTPAPRGSDIQINNQCPNSMLFAVHYLGLDGHWQTDGMWDFASGETAILASSAARLRTNNSIIYVYAEEVGGGGYKTNSSKHWEFKGRRLPMNELRKV